MPRSVVLIAQRLEFIGALFAGLQASGFDVLSPAPHQTEQLETLLSIRDEIDAALRLLRMAES